MIWVLNHPFLRLIVLEVWNLFKDLLLLRRCSENKSKDKYVVNVNWHAWNFYVLGKCKSIWYQNKIIRLMHSRWKLEAKKRNNQKIMLLCPWLFDIMSTSEKCMHLWLHTIKSYHLRKLTRMKLGINEWRNEKRTKNVDLPFLVAILLNWLVHEAIIISTHL